MTEPLLRACRATAPLRGRLQPPGDKSISHRALIFGALANGMTTVSGLLESDDVAATRLALAQMGAGFRETGGVLEIAGLGGEGLSAPATALDMGNSGTAMRLLAGVLAAQPFDSVLVGDASLSARPMRRIMTPLRAMGARIVGTEGDTAPLNISGSALQGIHYDSPVASAQVKSCVLLAGLYASGRTSVSEPGLSRDHSERMLRQFGAMTPDGSFVTGGTRLEACKVDVPADISSAAFLMAAACLVEGSDIELDQVGLNPTRDGLLRALKAMGADIEVAPDEHDRFEPAGSIRVRYAGRLRGIDLDQTWVPSMVDEIPVLMALAATAKGVTRIRGAAELRVKESDRLAVMGQGLRKMGVKVTEYPDGVDITGCRSLRDAVLESAGDHRCAMSFSVLGLLAPNVFQIRDATYIATSYPGFIDDMRALGAGLEMAA
jgi:3-phosphoshikimate 1-carboxyvinyltransferase